MSKLIKDIIALGNLPLNLCSTEKLAGEMDRQIPMDEVNFPLAHAVGRSGGVKNPPLLGISEYHYSDDAPTIVFIGKGLVYDTGGCQDKGNHMRGMHIDKTGAVIVSQLLKWAKRTKPKLNIIGLIGCAKNSDGPDAYVPGDVITARNGLKIEVTHTDAEGRLVLADVITYAKEHYPDADVMIDLATLTGAAHVALGSEYTALMSNSDYTCELLLGCKEKFWRLPCGDKHYVDGLKAGRNMYADYGSEMSGEAGTIAAGTFLGLFYGDQPFAHLDIASSSQKGYEVNGRPVSGLIEFIKKFQLTHELV